MRSSLACSLFVSACVLTLAPRPAAATSCLPTIDQWVPATDELLPVNALPHASFECGAELYGWEVEVDGEMAELVAVAPPFGGFGIVAMGINPEPIEGSVVEIRGCSSGCWDDVPEFDISRTYTVSDEDPEAPAAPVLLELGKVDEIVTEYDFENNEDVMVAVRRWNIHFEPPTLDEPVIWEISLGPAGAETHRARIMEPGDQNYVVTRSTSDAGTEVCATVRSYDLASNVSDDAVICLNVAEDDELPPIPGGTGDGGSDDGGSGDDGADGGSDGGGSDDGGDDGGTGGADGGADGGDGGTGGCSVAADGRGPAGLGALWGLMLLGLRRRVRG